MANSARAGALKNPALVNAFFIGAALVWGTMLLVHKGRLSWPPYQLLASVSTLAGCLALVGPLVFARSGSTERSLGELLWLTGGLLVWIFDIEGALRGDWRSMQWATPLSDRMMGLVILAVLLAGWKSGLTHWEWTWTSITGWVLGAFWIGVASGSWLLGPVWRAAWAVP
jgi:hypothetical protein